MAARSLPRYERAHEDPAPAPDLPPIAVADLEKVLRTSSLSPGQCEVVRALADLARPAVFGGGGVGLEYGALLKTAARPDLFREHMAEVARHLHEQRVDLLVVPGMSGYPIGAMYAQASGIPALLLKKQAAGDGADESAPGAFVIPSYTGMVDTIISADVAAARHILAGIVDRQMADQSSANAVRLEVRIGGSDEIIDKATMATAITENAPILVRAVIPDILAARVGQIAGRPVAVEVPVVSWVTPLLKSYGGATNTLTTRFGISPFAGAVVSAIQIDPPGIGIAGLGMIMLESPV